MGSRGSLAMWSPTWKFDDATFELKAAAFDNPDFVEVVIHSYRHRYGLAPGDPPTRGIEAALAAQPRSGVPAIAIDGDADGVNPGTAHHAQKFAGPHEHRVFAGAGHNLPQERPEAGRARSLTRARWRWLERCEPIQSAGNSPSLAQATLPRPPPPSSKGYRG